MTHSILYTGDNSHVVELVDLVDNANSPQTDATVQLTSLIDRLTGAPVTGVTLPLTMTHVSDGLYRGILPYGLSVIAGRVYVATITATGAQGFKGQWTETLLAQDRAA